MIGCNAHEVLRQLAGPPSVLRRADARYCTRRLPSKGLIGCGRQARKGPQEARGQASTSFRPSAAGRPPKPAPAPALQARDIRTGRVIDVALLAATALSGYYT